MSSRCSQSASDSGQALAEVRSAVALTDEQLARLTEALKARTGRDSNASGYVRDLIRRDQGRRAIFSELQALITEGIESGLSTRTKDDLRRLSRETAAARKA